MAAILDEAKHIAGVRAGNDGLRVDIAGETRQYDYLWLRDNCPCCRSSNGQRLHESNSIDPAIRPVSVQHSNDHIRIRWPDEHDSQFRLSFFSERPAAAPIRLWDATVKSSVTVHDYQRVKDAAAALKDLLSDVEQFGFGLLRNVPAEEGRIFDVVGLFGFVRETNYGRLFEVRAEDNPSNLAYTPVPLSVHTDNPYRDPCPTLQLLHCLVQAEHGGVTAIVDGFRAAIELRERDAEAFRLLCETPVTFRYESEDAVLEASGPIISLDGAGEPRRIRINNRSMAPLDLPSGSVNPFYAALFAFRQILDDDASQFRIRLEPGDLIILDNERVLHGRVGESIGARHLQGCYADRDGLLSKLRILERDAG